MFGLVNNWHNSHISPGVVSSVGDTNLSVKLKHSAPDLPLRWAPYSVGKSEERLGANIQDGVIGGSPARVFESGWLGKRGFKNAFGFTHQDLRATDRLHEPTLGQVSQFGWKSSVANVIDKPGYRFSKKPGGYSVPPGLLPRGGNLPQIVATEGTLESIVSKR